MLPTCAERASAYYFVKSGISVIPRGSTMEITYSLSDCPLGRLLVASTGKGLCLISTARTDAELTNRLASTFPDAKRTRDDKGMTKLRRSVEERIRGKRLEEDLPLVLHGTPFQVSVWKEMLKIPAGSTRSYAEIARRIGRPKAFRAVAQACGANPIPIVVPCHRVVASGGKLGGYTGGIEKKLSLLAAEGVENPRWSSAAHSAS
jgi:AraC family transcriptional regulator of adaptative response/methylated-DNA-[protein]-cysteine methyltransferase